MRRAPAAIGSLVFLVVAPGMVAGVGPWLLTRWHAHGLWMPLRVLGGILVVLGVALVLHGFARFVLEGLGTPAPVAPTERLVVGGAYRYVRNPIYVAVLAVIVGQWLLLGRAVLVIYAALVAIAFATFVRLYEEPTLRLTFGAEYEAYCRAVPAWLPRLTPWRGD